MINQVLPRMACGCAMLAFALVCGCQSMTGSSASKTASTRNPNDREVVSYWGQKKPKKANVDELKDKLDRAAEGDRGKLFADQMRLGNQHLRDDRLDDAKRAYERALTVKPDDPDCHHWLAVVGDKQQQFEVAEKHYDAALKERPRDTNLLSDYGYSNYLRGRNDQAEKILKEALSINPSHKGAMINLGAIYAKQGRQDEALAMFRRGAPEEDSQKYMKQLFEKAGAVPDISVAQTGSTDPRSAPPMPSEPDLKGMPFNQVAQLMQEKKAEGVRQRQQRMLADMQPPPRDSTDQNANAGFQNGNNQRNQPWMLGGNPPPSNPAPNGQLPVVTPSGGNPNANAQPYANDQQFAQNQPTNPAYSGQTAYANPNGSLNAQPGTSPNIEYWGGAARQNNTQSNVPNNPMPPGGNGWSQNQQAASQPQFNPSNNGPNNRIPWGDLQPGMDADPSNANPNFNAPNPGIQYAGMQNPAANSASMAAAQLGMNAGPGGLFPVVNTDAISQAGYSNQSSPGWNSRSGAEFPSPPEYQNPIPQYRASVSPADVRQGGFNSNQIAPPSLPSDWGQFNNPMAPAGNMPSPNGFAADSSTSNYRGSNPVRTDLINNWGDAAPAGGSVPYNGPWPPNGGQGTPNSLPRNNGPASNGAVNNGPANNGAANAPPMWNRGNNAPQARTIGPAATNSSSAAIPEQWPYSKGQ